MAKKFFTDASLSTFVSEIKGYTDDAVSTKANIVHSHDDKYYTKAEMASFELITVDEIDAICGAAIQVATLNEVTF